MFLIPLILAALPLSPAEEAKRDALAKYGHARWLANNQQLASAAKQLEVAAKLDPNAIAPKRDLVRLYADLGREDAAIRIARTILKADPADAVTARTLARIHLDSKQYREAGDVLASVIESPKLAKEPALKLSILRDLARSRQLAQDWPAAQIAWEMRIKFLENNHAALLRDGYKATDLLLEKAAAFEKLGQVCVERKEFREAIAAYESAAAIFRDQAEPDAAARLNWNLSGVYAAAGEPEKGLAALEKFLALHPRTISPYRRYAELLRQAKRGREVEPALEAMAIAQPKNAAIRWVFTAEMARRDFPSAHVRFQELLATTTEENFFELLVKTYSEQQRPAELLAIAEELFPVTAEKASAVTPAQSDRQQAFATALGKELAMAAPLLKEAKNRQSLSQALWDLLAWLAERDNRPAEVEIALRHAFGAARQEDAFAAFLRLSTHLARMRKWNAVLELCDSTATVPFEINRAIVKSDALAELDRGESALRLLARQHLANFHVRRKTAYILGVLGRHNEMLKALDAMLEEFNTTEEVRSIRTLRAEAFLGLNRFDEMEAELRGLLDDDPDDVLVLNNLGYNLADQNRKLPEAEALIRRAIEIDRRVRSKAGEPHAEAGVYLDSLGWVLFRRGQLAEARIELEKAVALPDGFADAIVWDHLGDVCFRLGDKAAAKKAWQNAAERYIGDHRGRQQGRAGELQQKLKHAE